MPTCTYDWSAFQDMATFSSTGGLQDVDKEISECLQRCTGLEVYLIINDDQGYMLTELHLKTWFRFRKYSKTVVLWHYKYISTCYSDYVTILVNNPLF